MQDKLVTQVITSPEGLEPLEAPWEKLWQRSPGASPYDTYAWIRSWCDAYAGCESLRVVVIWKGDSLVGVAPLYRTTRWGMRVLELLGLKGVNGECVGFLVEAGLEEPVMNAIQEALFDGVGRWEALSLYGVRSDAPLENLLFTRGLRLLRETRIVTSVVGPVPVIRCNGSWEAYLKGRSQKFRSHYNRNQTSCRQTGITLVRESEGTLPGEVVERLADVEARSWQGVRGKPLIGSNRPFFTQVLPRLIAARQAEIQWALLSDRPLAFSLNLQAGERGFMYITAYDASAARLSVGNAVNYAALKDLFDSGVQVVDYMTDIGTNTWKSSWTNAMRLSLRHVLVRKTIPGKVVGSLLCLTRR